MTMIESVGKKCAFLRAAVEAAGLHAQELFRAGSKRLTLCKPNVRHGSGVCTIADSLIEYSSSWLENGAYGVFPKGATLARGIDVRSWNLGDFAYEAIPSKTGDGAILKISEVSRVES